MSKYDAIISKVAREVAFEFAAPAGLNGHGYEVASREDIEQRVHLKLLEEGFDDAYFDKLDDPQGSIRLFARNAAQREVETRHRRHDGKGMGFKEAQFDFSIGARSEAAIFGEAVARKLVSGVPLPGLDILAAELEADLTALAEDLVSKVPEIYQAIVRAYYLGGEDIEELSGAEPRSSAYEAAGKRLQRGRNSLHDDEEASLRALRVYWHPDAKLVGRVSRTGTPTALLDILEVQA